MLRAAWLWALSLIGVWIAVATRLHQSLLTQQPSHALVAFGAIKGASLTFASAWRLIAAQWLHVNAGHMVLNAVVIAVIGDQIERRSSPWTMLLVGLIGGTAGAWIEAVTDPAGFVSGASQASASLCGAALVIASPRSMAWTVALVAMLVAGALDVHAVGSVKTGHVVGLAVGVASAILLRWRGRSHSSHDGG